jgi:hypothetical protein
MSFPVPLYVTNTLDKGPFSKQGNSISYPLPEEFGENPINGRKPCYSRIFVVVYKKSHGDISAMKDNITNLLIPTGSG